MIYRFGIIYMRWPWILYLSGGRRTARSPASVDRKSAILIRIELKFHRISTRLATSNVGYSRRRGSDERRCLRNTPQRGTTEANE